MTVKLLSYFYIIRKPGHTLNIDDKECLNFATFNFLGFVGNEKIEVLKFLMSQTFPSYSYVCCSLK